MSAFEEFADRERAGWADAAIAANYVEKFGPITNEAGATIVREHCRPRIDVLDLCTGQGNVAAMAADAGATVTGLDFSPVMLDKAKTAAPDVAFEEGDAAALPFEDDAFDLVICNFGMMHLPDQPGALAEVRRVLRPDGKFAMATWDAPQRSPAFGIFFGTLRQMLDMSKAPPQPDLFAFSEPDIAEKMLSDAGLAMTAHERITPRWTFRDKDGLFDIFQNATVAGAMLLKSLPNEMVAAIKERVGAAVEERHSVEDGYSVPVPVAIVTARPS